MVENDIVIDVDVGSLGPSLVGRLKVPALGEVSTGIKKHLHFSSFGKDSAALKNHVVSSGLVAKHKVLTVDQGLVRCS